MDWLLIAAALALVGWLYLWLAPSNFWRLERDPVPAEPEVWPEVIAVIPARNEVDVIARTQESLWTQDYPRPLSIILVDDHSDDGTKEAALEVTQRLERSMHFTLLQARTLPQDWAGKVWAMHRGVEYLLKYFTPKYVLFSDADIEHGPHAIRELVSRAEAERLDLASFMVRLECRSSAERLMIPAFVFFFRMLYPFRRCNDPKDPLAGAAGGTMLVRTDALRRIGGMEAIKDQLIDDCALARAVKAGGHRIWLGLGGESRSTRGYGPMREVIAMISRTAYTQLGYSPLVLVGCVFGMGLIYLAPVLATLFGSGASRVAGLAGLLLMASLYAPMVRYYGRPAISALLLPLTAALYLWATILSAIRHHQGRGGAWKGRTRRFPRRAQENQRESGEN
jgi:hopene-associated glycosyltransferase HpnB